MKKLILVLSLALLGCTSDNNSTTPAVPSNPNATNCNCGTIMSVNHFNMVNPPGSPTPITVFSVLAIKNNCTGEVRNVTINANTGTVGATKCNY